MHSSNNSLKVTLHVNSLKGPLVAVVRQFLWGNHALHKNFTNYAGIMLDALAIYYAQNYAGIIGLIKPTLKLIIWKYVKIVEEKLIIINFMKLYQV